MSNECRIFGLDGGIASIGWAVIDFDGETGRIVAAGARTFDAPEDHEKTPKNAIRRQKRGQRRVLRRRRERMQRLRRMLHEHGMLDTPDRGALLVPGLDPWILRVAGLDRALSPVEFAVALGHIARHRGFRSNAKARASNAADDGGKVKSGIQAGKSRLQGAWRTVGEMLARDPFYVGRKRNRDGDYSRSIERSDQEAEARQLFAAQRRFGSNVASEALAEAYSQLAFSQLPLQDSGHLVGPCPFIEGARRSARRARSFELFRLVSKLNTIKLSEGGHERRMSRDELAALTQDFGCKPRLTYGDIRKALALPSTTRFLGVTDEKEKGDVAAGKGAAEGTAALRKVLADAEWRELLAAPERLDAVAEVLTSRSDLGSIRTGLSDAGVSADALERIAAAAETGALACFEGAGHVSAEAARRLLPHLMTGAMYSEACKLEGFDHAARRAVDLDDVRNPVARKALGEMLKQFRAMKAAYGLPDRIHVELARDVGRGAEERDKIKRGIETRTGIKDKRRGAAAELLGRPVSDEELLRYELWLEQGARCLYTDEPIPPDGIAAGDQSFQVDHILPWSRFGDDSFVNKTLCTARANQGKRQMTPFEWLGGDEAAWAGFVQRVERCLEMKRFKKVGHYLRRNAAEVEEKFRTRNLNDTRYATRLLLDMLARRYPDDGAKHVLARPGALTARLRHAWGLDDLKRDADGKRLKDDRHHALDAIVLAATSKAMLERVTDEFKEAEARGQARAFGGLPQPWPGFREEARAAYDAVFVSRADRRRARGEAHEATIRQVRERDGKQVLFERKAVAALTEKDLGRVKDPERNAALIAVLRDWLAAGKPKDRPPLSYKSNPGSDERDVIRKVRLRMADQVAVRVRGGSAARGEMVRVDVFRGPNARGKTGYYLVPIYPHQVADRKAWPTPPDRACTANTPEAEWPVITRDHAFRFSVFYNSLISVTTANGEVFDGYFQGFDRSTGALTITPQESNDTAKRGIGARTLLDFKKFEVNRLGIITPVVSELRTWHGAACT